LDINISNQSNWEKVIEVSLPFSELEPDLEKAFQESKKKIRLEGFRKGKVPLQLIKKLFGKEIEAQMVEDKVPAILDDIREQYHLKLISPAKIDDFKFSKEEGLKFKAMIEVVPEIELQQYKGLALERMTYQIGDEDVAEALVKMQNDYAVMTNVDEEAKVGHFLIVDFQKIDKTGVPIVGEKFENKMIHLTDEDSNGRKELSDQLTGIKQGETRQVRLTTKVAGKENQIDYFDVTVKEIKAKKLPELDDEFAKDVGGFENLEVLKNRMKAELEFKYKEDYEGMFSQQVIDELVKMNQFDLPEPMIKNYLDSLIEKVKEDHKDQHLDEKKMREDYRGLAIRTLKWIMIKDKLCELESIKVEESDIDDFIEKVAATNEANRAKIINYYRQKDKREQLHDELVEGKVIHFIKNHAQITENTVTRKDLDKKSKIIT